MKSKGATESPEGFIVTEEVLLRFKENYRYGLYSWCFIPRVYT